MTTTTTIMRAMITTTDEARLLQWGCWDEIPTKRTHWLLAERPQNSLTISWQSALESELSREKTTPLWKPNEFDLIKMNLENISRTWHIQYIRSKAVFAGCSRASNWTQRAGLNTHCIPVVFWVMFDEQEEREKERRKKMNEITIFRLVFLNLIIVRGANKVDLAIE